VTDSFDYFAPVKGLPLGTRLSFLNDEFRIERRRDAIATVYRLFGILAASRNFFLTTSQPTTFISFSTTWSQRVFPIRFQG
jgi:hypothetical protein